MYPGASACKHNLYPGASAWVHNVYPGAGAWVHMQAPAANFKAPHWLRTGINQSGTGAWVHILAPFALSVTRLLGLLPFVNCQNPRKDFWAKAFTVWRIYVYI